MSFARLDASRNASRRVNSGVMSPLRMNTQLNPAAPLLGDGRVAGIIEKLVEGGCQLDHPTTSAHGISNQLSHSRFKSGGVRRGGSLRSDITSRSTRARDSFPFIIESVDLIEC